MVEFYAPDNNSSVSLEQKTEIIPPGINTKIFNPEYIAEDREAVRKSWGISDDEYVIVTGGRNRREKNFETVLHGFKRFFDLLPPNERSRVHLIVATGDNVKTDDPYITELLHALTTFSPEAQGKISFIAFQRYAPHLYAGADVFVAMSRLETFGSTVTEAMSCGLPVITSDIPSYEEQTAYRSQVNSLTIPVSSDERIMGNLLAQALQTTYTAYRSDDTALKDYSLERARPYSWRVSAVKLANLVQKIS
jgi:glycosyltransferase involved in cell wall biosynthesis